MLPNFEKRVLLIFLYLFISITPFWVDLSLAITIPLLSIYAEMPLFADLIIFLPSSIALKMACEKCWCGPIEFPNQPSSDILIIKLVFSDFKWKSYFAQNEIFYA